MSTKKTKTPELSEFFSKKIALEGFEKKYQPELDYMMQVKNPEILEDEGFIIRKDKAEEWVAKEMGLKTQEKPAERKRSGRKRRKNLKGAVALKKQRVSGASHVELSV